MMKQVMTEIEVRETARERKGLEFSRYFSQEGKSPYQQVQWETRTASIGNDKGAVIFEQCDVEVPADWSQTATNIVASKYFYGKPGSPERETSVAQLVHRVVDTIAGWGQAGGYFRTPADAENFRDELAHLMLSQKACFNSPVWFNVGVQEKRGYGWVYDRAGDRVRQLEDGERRPQCSACFIVSVKDSLESILDLAKTEGMLFKWGSGTGTNLSALREENAPLQGGGSASGPLSFMKGFDAFAGVIKSGGKTRRAAKMVILNADHPDVEKFIWCKAKEEKKAYTLAEAGYDAALDGEAYSSIFFQNANNSVRAADEFMEAVVSDAEWWTRSVVGGQPKDRYRARDLLRMIAEATHQCGDPGMQFDSTINRWHPCKNSGAINASNPCSEYMFLDDSACNLASLNLMRFTGPGGQFEVEAFRRAVETVILAQEIIVDNASYPTERIAQNSHDYRPLGLGFANLGALLMSLGIPYDSDRGRDYAAAITAVMCGQAYLTSARAAEAVDPFAGYGRNRAPFLEVIRMHRAAVDRIHGGNIPSDLWQSARSSWDEALELGARAGYRNGQVTVIAPTGTIGFMMDCDTTGIEPD
ncbi:MAG: vitamin B12-dependent ribonucleotide reductase, partial [Acidobacteria bacterium]|nr:vitamin B12-dependent ribonucleotide reductase [Acidobacteriota bacterium]